jgi:general secretion pathway protein I
MRRKFPLKNSNQGFTLIEVLLALAIIAIALTALLKSTGQNVGNTQRIKEKTISHWIAMQGVAAAQLGIIPITLTQPASQVTLMLDQRWYWRAKLAQTPIRNMQQIIVTVSKSPNGPFVDPLIAYRYSKE